MLYFLLLSLFPLYSIYADNSLPREMLSIMYQKKYQHATWGILVQNSETGQTLFDLKSEQMFLPASTTKLFSVAALLHAYGDDYRFKTPVYADGSIEEGRFQGNLILVGQGDLTFGGRQSTRDILSFTKLDHLLANVISGVILTKEDPLKGIKSLAKQIKDKGIKEVNGNVLIDDRLFESTEKRGVILSPILINENLIDFVINPTQKGEKALLKWRPIVKGYTIINEVVTGNHEDHSGIQVTTDASGRKIIVKGTISINEKEITKILSVKDPCYLAQSAFIQALEDEGIAVKLSNETVKLPSKSSYSELKPIAVWTSPPLSEYAKLILKVSHNVGADLIPLLLAVQEGKTTFEEGMQSLGNFIVNDVKISEDAFVFIDGAGGDENRVTLTSELQLLKYMHKQSKEQFEVYFSALPILGVDGSLADSGLGTSGVGKVHAKTGTGISFNLATNHFFLTTQTLSGYIEGKNGHLLAFMISVNNGRMHEIDEVFGIFDDLSQLASLIYEHSN